MRARTGLLLRLYPDAWRKRYGCEFEALVEESGADWRTCFDLLKGAMKMHFTVSSLPKMVGLLAGVGLLIGFGASYLLTPRYVSTATMRYAGGAERVEQVIQTQNEVLSRTGLSAIMQDPKLNLYSAERQSVPVETVIETMRHDIRISVAASGSAFSISFVYPDPAKARATVQELVTKFIDTQIDHKWYEARNGSAIERLQQRVAELEKRLNIQPSLVPVMDRGSLEVLDPPSMPVNPIYPNRAMCAATGFISGIVLALIVYAFRRPTNRIVPMPSPV